MISRNVSRVTCLGPSTACLGMACLILVGLLSSRSAPAAAPPPIELRVRLTTDKVCPLDSYGVIVEYRNTSDHDVTIEVPSLTGAYWTNVTEAPEGGAPPWGSRGIPGPSPGARLVVLKPGERVETPTLWVHTSEHPWRRSQHRLDVYARYQVVESDLDNAVMPVDPTPMSVTSDPCHLAIEWCDPRMPDILAVIDQSMFNWPREKVQKLLDEVIRTGPPCAQRRAWRVLFGAAMNYWEDADLALAACQELWRMASGTPEKEDALFDLDYYMLAYGRCDVIAKLVGDYDSPEFGPMQKHCKKRAILTPNRLRPPEKETPSRPQVKLPPPDPRLELRAHLTSNVVCPFDVREVVVEFMNRSQEDLVLNLPVADKRGYLCVGGCAIGGKPYGIWWWGGDVGQRVTLHPGESVSALPDWFPASYPTKRHEEAVCAQYYSGPEAQTGSTDPVTPLYACSEPVTIRYQWCHPRGREWYFAIDKVKCAQLWGEHPEAADEIVNKLLAEGPHCVQRAALEARLHLHVYHGTAASKVEACKRLWAIVKEPWERARAISLFDEAIEEGADPLAVAEIVGDYDSRKHGNYRKYCEEIAKKRAAEPGEKK